MAVRLSRNVWIGGGVVAAAGLAVGVGWLLAGPSGGTESEPTPYVTVTAEAGDPTPEPSETVDPYEGDLDGILADEYPEPTPTRTDPNADLEVGAKIDYPDALVMEDWVWDRVGAGWSIEAVSVVPTVLERYGDLGETWQMPPAVLYLVSPEDVYFEVGELPERMWADARVVSWDEDREYVRLAWDYSYGGRYDLRTGASDDLRFSVYGAPSTHVEFVTANADGDELWRARSDEGFKYYRWDASTDEWAASALVEELPEAGSLDLFPGSVGRHAVSPDGDTLVVADYGQTELGYRAGRTGVFAAYVLSNDDLALFEIPELASEDYVYYRVDAEGVRLASAMLDGETYFDYIFSSGSVSSGPLSEGTFGPTQAEPWEGRVGWGESTNEAAAWFECGC